MIQSTSLISMSSIPEKLSESVLSCRSLPDKPTPVILEGRYVRLVPLDLDRDVDALYLVSNGSAFTLGDKTQADYDSNELVWKYMWFGPFASADELREALIGLLSVNNMLVFCVFDIATNHQVGVFTFMCNFPQHLKIEIGHIWYSPIVQRTATNTETCYLALKHLFGLGYRRVEWKCDSLNERSRRAAQRLGFVFEALQECHMIVKGRNRDTTWYRILDDEWNGVRSRLEQILHQD